MGCRKRRKKVIDMHVRVGGWKKAIFCQICRRNIFIANPLKDSSLTVMPMMPYQVRVGGGAGALGSPFDPRCRLFNIGPNAGPPPPPLCV